MRIADRELGMKKELEARTKRFALSVIELVVKLRRGKASDIIGYQLLKSGTSIGANYREANRAESHDDFIHKVGICEKEAAETEILAGTGAGGEFDHIYFNRRAVARSSRTVSDICGERPNCQITSLSENSHSAIRSPEFLCLT